MSLKGTICSSRTIILVNVISHENYSRANKILKNLLSKAKDYNLVCFNSQPPVFLHGLKAKCSLSEDYLSASDYDSIDKHIVRDISKNWHLLNLFGLECVTSFKGFDLGKIAEYNFQQFLIPRIKNLSILGKLLKQYSPDKVIVIEDTGELLQTARFFTGNKGLDFLSFKLPLGGRTFLARFKSELIDCFAGAMTKVLDCISIILLKIYKNDSVDMLVDKKIFSSSEIFRDKKRFMPTPFEKGLRVRRNMLMEGHMYLPACFSNRGSIFINRKAFLARWKRLKTDKTFQNYFVFQGINYWKIAAIKLSSFYLVDFPRIARNIRITQNFIRERHIRAILLRNDMREFERTAIVAAKMFNIPCLVIQHGILAEENFVDEMFADATFIWGEASKNWFNPDSVVNRVFVTGNPRYDYCFKWKPHFTKQDIFDNLKLDINKVTVLFASQAIVKFSSYRTDDENEVLTGRVLDFFRTAPDYQLIIKIHPYEDINVYKNVVEQSGLGNVRVVKDVNIIELINSCDLLLTKNSTTGLEAMIFDKPVVTIELGKRREQVPYGATGAAISVHNTGDIKAAIEKSLKDSKTQELLKANRAKFVYDYAYKIDGLAAKRISDKIEEILIKGLVNTKNINEREGCRFESIIN